MEKHPHVRVVLWGEALGEASVLPKECIENEGGIQKSEMVAVMNGSC